MKKILSLLGTITLIATNTASLVACNTRQEYTKNELEHLKEENQKLKEENQKLKEENQKLKEENQKLKWKIDKNILFINYINSPIMIKVGKPNEAKEFELTIALTPKVLESIKTIDDSLTETDFTIGYKDYFVQNKPRSIDLTTPKKITIIVEGHNKASGKKEFDVVLTAAILNN